MKRLVRKSVSQMAGRALIVLGLTIAFATPSLPQIADPPPRIAFEISTGSTTGTYFPVGQTIAQLLSHPPGVGRCEAADVCGPAGLIMTTRASPGSAANVASVNAGMSNSALAQSDAVAMAIAGRGAFAKSGPASALRVIASVYGEDVHLIAAKEAKISSVEDLRGKRVGISTEGSGTIITARAILAAYRLNERMIVPNYDSADKASDLLQSGRLDAVFFVGGAPVNLVEQLLNGGASVLVPIGGAGRERLLARDPYLSARAIPEGTYSSSAATETVSVDALWVTHESQPEALVYSMVKALFNPANRATLDAARVGARFLDPALAVPAGFPIHPGAMRYYIEEGLAKPPTEKVSLPPAPSPRKS